MLNESFSQLLAMLLRQIPEERIYRDELNRLAKGTDASIYRLIPQMVVRVDSLDELQHCINSCRDLGISLTFKAGGTSLSGQTVTDSLLVELGRNWDAWQILDEGRRIRLQPGMLGEAVNTVLKPYGRKFPPAPASIAAAKVGGILANNASGNSYGIAYNSYHCHRGMRLHFSDGSVLDTRDPDSRAAFAESHPDMLDGISSIRRRILADEEMKETILRKYRLKNTTGYGMNSFVDFEDPLDIIAQLMIGSEGTLAFISEVDFETVEEAPLHAAALLFFPSLLAAGQAVAQIRTWPVLAAELMDRAALKAVEDVPGLPAVLKQLPGEVTAVLIDTAAHSWDELDRQIAEISAQLPDLGLSLPAEFTSDPLEYSTVWKVRKGLFTSASASRRPGTAVVIEDLVFPMNVLGDALEALQSMLKRYGYHDSVIWGHVMDGNIHFVIMEDFSNEEALSRYAAFMVELSDLVIDRFRGSLKGEHGTGRNMAPFVEKEWGAQIYALMKEVKGLLDPRNIFNPGVLINDDPGVHLKNLKRIPAVNPLIDACIECGFCEHSCPSRDLTLTPRQRIVAFREIASSPYPNPPMAVDFQYAGEETCATDGLCELSCPVGINTGVLVKELRSSNHTESDRQVADWIAGKMGYITHYGRYALNAVHWIHKLAGSSLMTRVAEKLHQWSGRRIPLWNRHMPLGASPVPPLPPADPAADTVVYFPTCINRTMGNSAGDEGSPGLMENIVELLSKAGYRVVYPPRTEQLCCGMAFASKGFHDAAADRQNELNEALMEATQQGTYPVLTDMSPCLQHMRSTLNPALHLYEPVEFIHDRILPRLQFEKRPGSITIHNTCSTVKMGLQDKFRTVAEALSEEVIVPQNVGCCGWAGDRGFTHPELNRSALADLKKALPDSVREGYSNSRTCEIGLSLHSDRNYRSIVFLANACASEEKIINKEE